MALFPWWIDLLLIAAIGALLIKVGKLSREAKKLKRIVRRLEGRPEVVEAHESGHGDAEGRS